MKKFWLPPVSSCRPDAIVTDEMQERGEILFRGSDHVRQVWKIVEYCQYIDNAVEDIIAKVIDAHDKENLKPIIQGAVAVLLIGTEKPPAQLEKCRYDIWVQAKVLLGNFLLGEGGPIDEVNCLIGAIKLERNEQLSSSERDCLADILRRRSLLQPQMERGGDLKMRNEVVANVVAAILGKTQETKNREKANGISACSLVCDALNKAKIACSEETVHGIWRKRKKELIRQFGPKWRDDLRARVACIRFG